MIFFTKLRISQVKYGIDRDEDFNENSLKSVDMNTDISNDEDANNITTENHGNGSKTVLESASNQDELSSRCNNVMTKILRQKKAKHPLPFEIINPNKNQEVKGTYL
jgi:hypothetical protein